MRRPHRPAHALGLEVLLEIHSPRELAYISKDVDMVGVNNRNLGTFVTDVENSFRIAGQLRQTIADVRNIPDAQDSSDTPRNRRYLSRKAVFRTPKPSAACAPPVSEAFIIGETFMKTPQPGDALKGFIQGIEEPEAQKSL